MRFLLVASLVCLGACGSGNKGASDKRSAGTPSTDTTDGDSTTGTLSDFKIHPLKDAFGQVTWDASTGAVSYLFSFGKQQDCSTPAVEATVTTPQYDDLSRGPRLSGFICVTAVDAAGGQRPASNNGLSNGDVSTTSTPPPEDVPPSLFRWFDNVSGKVPNTQNLPMAMTTADDGTVYLAAVHRNLRDNDSKYDARIYKYTAGGVAVSSGWPVMPKGVGNETIKSMGVLQNRLFIHRNDDDGDFLTAIGSDGKVLWDVDIRGAVTFAGEFNVHYSKVHGLLFVYQKVIAAGRYAVEVAQFSAASGAATTFGHDPTEFVRAGSLSTHEAEDGSLYFAVNDSSSTGSAWRFRSIKPDGSANPLFAFQYAYTPTQANSASIRVFRHLDGIIVAGCHDGGLRILKYAVQQVDGVDTLTNVLDRYHPKGPYSLSYACRVDSMYFRDTKLTLIANYYPFEPNQNDAILEFDDAGEYLRTVMPLTQPQGNRLVSHNRAFLAPRSSYPVVSPNFRIATWDGTTVSTLFDASVTSEVGGDDGAVAVKRTSKGLLVGGFAHNLVGANTGMDVYIKLMSQTGELAWSYAYDSALDGYETLVGLEVDADHNVYAVCAKSSGQMYLLKLDASGKLTQGFPKQFTAEHSPSAMRLHQGRLYVSATQDTELYDKGVLLAFDLDGNEMLRILVPPNGTTPSKTEIRNFVIHDAALYVAAVEAGDNVLLAAYKLNGDKIWSRTSPIEDSRVFSAAVFGDELLLGGYRGDKAHLWSVALATGADGSIDRPAHVIDSEEQVAYLHAFKDTILSVSAFYGDSASALVTIRDRTGKALESSVISIGLGDNYSYEQFEQSVLVEDDRICFAGNAPDLDPLAGGITSSIDSVLECVRR